MPARIDQGSSPIRRAPSASRHAGRGDVDQLEGGAGGVKCVAGLGLHGDDTDRGGECKAEARRESPTSDGGEHRVEIRHLLDQFDAQRGLPCHREWRIVRVDLQCIDRSGTCVTGFLGIVIELTDDIDQCALSPKADNLRW